MTRMGLLSWVTLAIALTSTPACAQDSTSAPSWTFSASLWGYLVPDQSDYLQPTFIANYDWLHLEGRYNYEERNTGSFWVGYNFSFGHDVAFEVTPIVGGVVGGLTGLGAGYELSVTWWKLALASDTEYVWDAGDVDGSFLYNWTQIGISPWPWLEVGLTGQRTRAYQSDRDFQSGFFAALYWKVWNAGVYVLNPDESPIVVIATGADF